VIIFLDLPYPAKILLVTIARINAEKITPNVGNFPFETSFNNHKKNTRRKSQRNMIQNSKTLRRMANEEWCLALNFIQNTWLCFSLQMIHECGREFILFLFSHYNSFLCLFRLIFDWLEIFPFEKWPLMVLKIGRYFSESSKEKTSLKKYFFDKLIGRT